MTWVKDKAADAEEDLLAAVEVDRAGWVVLRLLDQADRVYALSVVTSRRTEWASHATRWFVPSAARA